MIFSFVCKAQFEFNIRIFGLQHMNLSLHSNGKKQLFRSVFSEVITQTQSKHCQEIRKEFCNYQIPINDSKKSSNEFQKKICVQWMKHSP
jgi:hypothetical protein